MVDFEAVVVDFPLCLETIDEKWDWYQKVLKELQLKPFHTNNIFEEFERHIEEFPKANFNTAYSSALSHRATSDYTGEEFEDKYMTPILDLKDIYG